MFASVYSSGKKTKDLSTIKFRTPLLYRSFTKALPCLRGPGIVKNNVVEGNNNLRLSMSKCSMTADSFFSDTNLPDIISAICAAVYCNLISQFYCNCFINSCLLGKYILYSFVNIC